MSLYTPPNAILGELVIMCTWLGAAPKHIAKYTTLYQSIAPRAKILLIQSGMRIITSTYNRQAREIKPAVKTLMDVLGECGIGAPVNGKGQNEGSDSTDHLLGSINNSHANGSAKPKASPKILFHTFSNGGANSATQLLINLHVVLGRPLPIIGMVCDSCPAKGTYNKSYVSFLYALPKGFFGQVFGRILCHAILIMLHASIWLGRYSNPGALIRESLLEPQYICAKFPQDEEEAMGRVVYIFSKEDKMTYWKDVTDHAAEARAKGWEVVEILVHGSVHCGHLQKGSDKYADAVKQIWDGGNGWESQLRAKL